MRKRYWKGQRASGLAIAFAVTLLPIGALAQAPQPQPTAPASNQQSLDTLEGRFFEHKYAGDPTAKRLERIEKLVFGEARQGSETERLNNLFTAISSSYGEPAAKAAKPREPEGRAPGKTSCAVANPSDYPSVSALERELLNSMHREDSVRTRLERLELKAFGKPAQSSDLSLRVSELQQYAREHGVAENDRSQLTVKYVPPPPTEATLETKVTWLEEQVYGRAVPDSSIFDRVRRLNLSVLPKSYREFDGSIPENVNTLVSAVELEQADRVNGTQPAGQFRPVPQSPPGGYATTLARAKLNKTASVLNDVGMPNPLTEIGAAPSSLATTSANADADDATKKKKKHGFWSALKETMDESYSDTIMGVPRYAYGD